MFHFCKIIKNGISFQIVNLKINKRRYVVYLR